MVTLVSSPPEYAKTTFSFIFLHLCVCFNDLNTIIVNILNQAYLFIYMYFLYFTNKCGLSILELITERSIYNEICFHYRYDWLAWLFTDRCIHGRSNLQLQALASSVGYHASLCIPYRDAD